MPLPTRSVCGPSEHPLGASTSPDFWGLWGDRVASAPQACPNSKESTVHGATRSPSASGIPASILRPPHHPHLAGSSRARWPTGFCVRGQARTPALCHGRLLAPSVPGSFSHQCFCHKLLSTWFDVYYCCVCPARATTNATNNPREGGFAFPIGFISTCAYLTELTTEANGS